jgi:hypothetical protein
MRGKGERKVDYFNSTSSVRNSKVKGKEEEEDLYHKHKIP